MMDFSVLDLFTIGIGPSSSHTVGPMRAALRFVQQLAAIPSPPRRLHVELFGSLGLTGRGHGTDRAVLLGLEGETPEEVDATTIEARVQQIRAQRQIVLPGGQVVPFDPEQDLVFVQDRFLLLHHNGMRFSAYDDQAAEILSGEYYSVGGGFVVDAHSASTQHSPAAGESAPSPGSDDGPSHIAFTTAAEMLDLCHEHHLSISQLMLANENLHRPEAQTRARLTAIWNTMQECVRRGYSEHNVLPGDLHLKRRAAALHQEMCDRPEQSLRDPLTILDWVTVYALAVSEENAAGGRVVTAPTNGAAGIVPAVLHYYTKFCPAASEEGVHRFLLTAGAVGLLYKRRASLSGAEVGCQGEVGVACSMAAAGLAEVLGGTPEQVENAAEIAMEHNLGLTCDPVRGLVQIPCIERNAMGAIKALSACRLALHGDGQHRISLDAVITTMRQTGADMLTKYKETSLGGLAVSSIEC